MGLPLTGYMIEFRLDTDNSKEFYRAFVMAKCIPDAKDFVSRSIRNRFSENNNEVSICFKGVIELTEGEAYLAFEEDCDYRIIDSVESV